MADWYIHCDSHFNSLDVYNMEMPVEPEQGAVTAGSHFREGALDLMEDLRLISDLNHESEVIQIDQVNHKDGDENHKSHGRCQDPGEVQLQEPLPLATAVPQHPRRRSRVLFKLAAWQVQELENVFKKIQYPDVLT
uniref:Rhox homeobox family member 1-like n=1 Tax=Castor canadensis TaxID=51338 RepID=A0A8B7TGK4_CASCN